MGFDLNAYGEQVAHLLALAGNGNRPMPLVTQGPDSDEVCQILKSTSAPALFPKSVAPRGAFAGLWLYFSCFEEAHETAQDDGSVEGSFWHAILHRQEPDSGNAAYWFRRVGEHPIFPKLVDEAVRVIQRYPDAEFRPSVRWDPFGFILFCERARQQPGSPSQAAALEIQLAEWQLLFDYCARPKK